MRNLPLFAISCMLMLNVSVPSVWACSVRPVFLPPVRKEIHKHSEDNSSVKETANAATNESQAKPDQGNTK